MTVTTRVTISSVGDEWPDQIKSLTEKLKDEGYEEIANGSSDSSALPDEPNPKKLWLVYERKVE